MSTVVALFNNLNNDFYLYFPPLKTECIEKVTQLTPTYSKFFAMKLTNMFHPHALKYIHCISLLV